MKLLINIKLIELDTNGYDNTISYVSIGQQCINERQHGVSIDQQVPENESET